MPKKAPAPKKAAKPPTKKKAAKKVPTIPNTPGDTQPPLPVVAEPPKPIWREVGETRSLKTPFSLLELDAHNSELVRSVSEATILDGEKKASAQSYGHKIETLKTRQQELASMIQNGFDFRSTKCHWVFETCGKDASGVFVPHPNFKTLVRDDSGEVVETVPLTESDYRQYQELPLEFKKDEPAKPLATIQVNGETVAKMDDDGKITPVPAGAPAEPAEGGNLENVQAEDV